jgi:hypothetical protein
VSLGLTPTPPSGTAAGAAIALGTKQRSSGSCKARADHILIGDRGSEVGEKRGKYEIDRVEEVYDPSLYTSLINDLI